MNGAHRAVVALRHGVEHRDDLVASHLADDHRSGFMRRLIRTRSAAVTSPTPSTLRLALQCHAVGVQVLESFEPEASLGLDGHDPLGRRDLGRERSKHGRLARAGGTAHDDLPSRPDGCPETARCLDPGRRVRPCGRGSPSGTDGDESRGSITHPSDCEQS